MKFLSFETGHLRVEIDIIVIFGTIFTSNDNTGSQKNVEVSALG